MRQSFSVSVQILLHLPVGTETKHYWDSPVYWRYLFHCRRGGVSHGPVTVTEVPRGPGAGQPTLRRGTGTCAHTCQCGGRRRGWDAPGQEKL
jgi:hypothetical protein